MSSYPRIECTTGVCKQNECVLELNCRAFLGLIFNLFQI